MTKKSMRRETVRLEDILVEDDASRYLASLPPERRGPQDYGLNHIPEEGPSRRPTPQEREALRAMWRRN
jgi:hypothetical protein